METPNPKLSEPKSFLFLDYRQRCNQALVEVPTWKLGVLCAILKYVIAIMFHGSEDGYRDWQGLYRLPSMAQPCTNWGSRVSQETNRLHVKCSRLSRHPRDPRHGPAPRALLLYRFLGRSAQGCETCGFVRNMGLLLHLPRHRIYISLLRVLVLYRIRTEPSIKKGPTSFHNASLYHFPLQHSQSPTERFTCSGTNQNSYHSLHGTFHLCQHSL
jgi:hypothetical protein